MTVRTGAAIAFAVALVLSTAADGADKRASKTRRTDDTLTKNLRDPLPANRIKAANSLGAMGTGAAWASSDLCAALIDRNPNVRLAVMEALEKVQPEVHAVAVPIVIDESREKRLEQIRKVIELGDELEAVLPVLLWRFRLATGEHPDFDEAQTCLKAMFAAAKTDEKVVDTILDTAAKDRNDSMRATALQMLPDVGSKERKRAVGILTAALKSDTDGNKLIAMTTLVKFGKHAAPAIDTLKKLKGSSNSTIRDAAADALKKIEKAANNAGVTKGK